MLYAGVRRQVAEHLARIKIAQVAAKVETPGERQATTAKVEEERKNQVDVRVYLLRRHASCVS